MYNDTTQTAPMAQEQEPWRLLAGISAIGFILIGGMLTSLSVYLSIMQPHFGWNEVQLGAGPVALLLGMSAGNLVVGMTMRRFGIRGSFSLGSAIACGGWALAALVQSLPEFIGAMGLVGFGAGIATIVPGIALITQTFHRRRGMAMALFIGSLALASSVMPQASSWLIEALGWSFAFAAFGVTGGMICLGVLHILRRDMAQAVEPERSAQNGSVLGLVRAQVLRHPGYWALVLSLTISQLAMNGVLFNAIPYLVRSGFAQPTAVDIYSFANLVSVPGLVIGGYLSDRFSARVLFPAILVIQAVGTVSLLGTDPSTTGHAQLSAGLFILVWGGISGLPAQSGSLLLNEIIGQRAFTSMLGILFTITGVIGALAPIAMGSASEITGGYFWPFLALGALLIVAALASLTFVKRSAAHS